MFKVGDRVRCVCDDDTYWITNKLSELVVEGVDSPPQFQIRVRVIGHKEDLKKEHIGETWWVNAENFVQLTKFKGNKHATAS